MKLVIKNWQNISYEKYGVLWKKWIVLMCALVVCSNSLGSLYVYSDNWQSRIIYSVCEAISFPLSSWFAVMAAADSYIFQVW